MDLNYVWYFIFCQYCIFYINHSSTDKPIIHKLYSAYDLPADHDVCHLFEHLVIRRFLRMVEKSFVIITGVREILHHIFVWNPLTLTFRYDIYISFCWRVEWKTPCPKVYHWQADVSTRWDLDWRSCKRDSRDSFILLWRLRPRLVW